MDKVKKTVILIVIYHLENPLKSILEGAIPDLPRETEEKHEEHSEYRNLISNPRRREYD
jgi:hypothetical protein